MSDQSSRDHDRTIIIVGASRGLGHAMAARYLDLGWRVVGTVRAGARATPLHALAAEAAGRLAIETVDICEPAEVATLRERLAGRRLDTLFVNAGVTNDPRETIGEVTTEEFVRVMVTNALSPLRVIERLQDLVPATGLIGVMSSGQGSVADNVTGMRELYRGSKAALNMFLRSFAARHAGDPRALVAMAPGWVRTDMGGGDAPLDVETSARGLVDTILAHRGEPGSAFYDYSGAVLPW